MNRSRRCGLRPHLIPLDRIARGEVGERAFQDWLDRSHCAYLYLDQTPLTIPLALRSEMKRPDFLVAVDGLGPVAVDVKAKWSCRRSSCSRCGGKHASAAARCLRTSILVSAFSERKVILQNA